MKKILFIGISLLCFTFLTNNVSAASATLETIGSNTFYFFPGECPHSFCNTFQIGLKLSSIEGTKGIAYMQIKINYDNNTLSCYGGAFYSLPNMGWDPPAGMCNGRGTDGYTTIRVGSPTVYENSGYLTAGIDFYAINFKPNENIANGTTVKFEVVAAKDAEGNEIQIDSVSFNIKLGTISQASKSNNNNNNKLKTLTVTGYSIPFDKNITRYYLDVANNVTELKVSAATDDDKAKFVISNNKNLKIGKNTIEIKVTAEDGSINYYNIIVTRADANKSNNAYLKLIDIEDYNLDTNFDKNTLEYSISVPYEVVEININAQSEDSKSSVIIEGNKDLEVGENVATILVTAEDGSKKTYTVNIIKKGQISENEETGGKITPRADGNKNIWSIVIGSVSVIIAGGISFIFWKKDLFRFKR